MAYHDENGYGSDSPIGREELDSIRNQSRQENSNIFQSQIDRLRFIIDLMEQINNISLKANFLASPIEPLVEVAIDVMILLSNAFIEDHRSLVHRSPSIAFSEEEQDVLGNPKQFKKTEYDRNIISAPLGGATRVCREVTSYLIALKRNIVQGSRFDHEIQERDLLNEIKEETNREFHIQNSLCKANEKVKKRNNYFGKYRKFRR